MKKKSQRLIMGFRAYKEFFGIEFLCALALFPVNNIFFCGCVVLKSLIAENEREKS